MNTYLQKLFATTPPHTIEYLNLDYDYIANEISAKFYAIEGLEDCFALQKLILSHHEISSIDGLTENIHLQYLDLSHNYIREIENLEHLEKLTHLNLSYNDLRSMKGLSSLTSLTYLNLGHNKIKKIEEIHTLKHLKTLILSGNKSIISLQGLETQTQLEQLYIKQCRITAWSVLRALNNLQELYASPIQISDMYDALKHTHLHILHLSNRELNRMDKIPHISTLRKLSITGCAFVQYITGLEENPQLQELDVSNNTILELNGIQHITGLEVLDVRNNNLRTISVQSLPTSIKKLRISGNPLTHDTVSALQEWAKQNHVILEL